MSVAADFICSVGIDDLRDIAFISRMTVSPGDIDSFIMPRIALTVAAFVIDLVENILSLLVISIRRIQKRRQDGVVADPGIFRRFLYRVSAPEIRSQSLVIVTVVDIRHFVVGIHIGGGHNGELCFESGSRTDIDIHRSIAAAVEDFAPRHIRSADLSGHPVIVIVVVILLCSGGYLYLSDCHIQN